MPKYKYETLRFGAAARRTIEQANAIIQKYQSDGFDLTLRQLYYQFVSRDLLPNLQSEYKRLGDIISRGRRAGLIDWLAIVDRTRNLQRMTTWDSPEEIVNACARSYQVDVWATQPVYVEIWYEKDALMGVFERPARQHRVPHFSCRGYTSDSEIWRAARRFADAEAHGQSPLILHFGDHDPSGLDMSRDISERVRLFGAHDVVVRRIALSMDQIRKYKPPPNPAKDTDSRFVKYRDEFGDESWELDALDPAVLAALVDDEVAAVIDQEAWDAAIAVEDKAKAELSYIAEHYQRITKRRRS